MFKVLAYGSTNVGRERKNNEDAFRIAPDAGVYLVCDGMGGHASGEIASQIAADAIVRFVALERHRPEFRWPAEVAHQMSEEARSLDAAVRMANSEVFAASIRNPAHKGMGTTVAGVLAGPTRLALVHVGDSRIYRYRDGELEQLTDDHSLLNHYLRTRPMSAQQIKQFAGKNVIVRAVGLRDAVEPDIQLQEYRRDDVYLLCSDGLTDMVEDPAISDVVAHLAASAKEGRQNLAEAGEQLIELALQGGGKDNVTVLLLQVVEVPDQPRIASHERATLTMMEAESLLDTSPGFDIRKVPRPGASEAQGPQGESWGPGDKQARDDQDDHDTHDERDVVDEETLPEFSLPAAALPRKFVTTQEVAHKPWDAPPTTETMRLRRSDQGPTDRLPKVTTGEVAKVTSPDRGSGTLPRGPSSGEQDTARITGNPLAILTGHRPVAPTPLDERTERLPARPLQADPGRPPPLPPRDTPPARMQETPQAQHRITAEHLKSTRVDGPSRAPTPVPERGGRAPTDGMGRPLEPKPPEDE